VNDYGINDASEWLTLSPRLFYDEGSVFRVSGKGLLDFAYMWDSIYSRQAVTLNEVCTISEGIGTQDSPYVIQ